MLKNVLYYVLGGFVGQGAVFVLWLILPSFLRSTDIGSYNFMMYYVDMLSAIVVLGGDAVLVRYYYSKFKQTDVLSSVFYTSLFSNIFLTVLILLNTRYEWYPIRLQSPFLLFCLPLLIFVNSFANLILIHYSALKEARKYTKIQFIKISIFCVMSLLLCYLGLGVTGLVVGLFISCLITILLFLPRGATAFFSMRPSKQLLKESLTYGIPLMLYSIIGILSLYASRLFLEKYLGLAMMGVFGFFLIISLQVNGFWSSFNKAWAPEVYSKMENNKSKDFIYNAIYMVTFVYLFCLATGCVVGDLFLFKLVFRPEYRAHIDVLIILLVFPVFTSVYTMLYPLFYFDNKTKVILAITFVSTSINLFCLYMLIAKIGMTGAAIGTVAGSFVNLCIYLFVFRKVTEVKAKTIQWLLLLTVSLSGAIFILVNGYGKLLFAAVLFGLSIITFFMGGVYQYIRQTVLTFRRKSHLKQA